MTFYATIAGTDAHVDLVLALRIEGVSTALVERAIPAAVATSLSGYTQFIGITRVDEGEAVLDMQERREIAASLQIDLLDDDARTLSSLFAVNKRPLGRVYADATASATTIYLDSTGMAATVNGQTVWTDYETITLGVKAGAGTRFDSCTRGAFGSTSAALWGESSANVVDGEQIYSVPPAWRGRRAYLYGYVLRADGGGFEQLLGTWIIDEAPKHTGDDSWSLTLASIAQEYYERSIGLGLRTTTIIYDSTYPTFSTVGDRTVITLKVDDPSAFRAGTTFPTYVLAMTFDDQPIAIFELYSVNTSTAEVACYLDSMFTDNIGNNTGTSAGIGKLRPIAFCGTGALPYILLSTEGQGATTYDRLPGRLEQSINDPGWRIGAGFTTSEVDISSIAPISANAPRLCFVIDEQQPVSDLLREFCQLSDTATRIDTQGRLSAFSIASTRVDSATVVTLGPNSVVPDSRIEVVADEESLYALAKVRCDYSPFTREFGVEVAALDAPTLRRYRRAPQTLELDFKSFGVSDEPAETSSDGSVFVHPARIALQDVPTLVERLQRGDGAFARRMVRLTVTLAHLNLRIGDVVALSGLPDAFSRLPDMEGGTLEGVRGRIVARRPRYDEGRIDIQIAILEPVVLVCPAAVITAAAGTTLTLSTTDDTVAAVGVPGQNFIVGVGVRIYDVSAGTSHVTSVSSVTGTQIVVGSAPAFAIETGVDYVVLSPYSGSTSTSAVNIFGNGLAEMAVVVPTPPAAPTSGLVTTKPRWR